LKVIGFQSILPEAKEVENVISQQKKFNHSPHAAYSCTQAQTDLPEDPLISVTYLLQVSGCSRFYSSQATLREQKLEVQLLANFINNTRKQGNTDLSDIKFLSILSTLFSACSDYTFTL
jgi:hypothetical protein